MSVRALAERSGVSTSFVSQVEADKTNPTLAKLESLAMALGVPVDAFFGPHDAPDEADRMADTEAPAARPMPLHSGVPAEVVRGEGRTRVEARDGVRRERLTPRGLDGIEFLDVTYAAGASSGALASHPGQEFMLIVDGALEVRLAFDTVVLRRGDSLAFDSPVPHSVRNSGTTPSRALWVNWSFRQQEGDWARDVVDRPDR